jgi:hypothetical protein
MLAFSKSSHASGASFLDRGVATSKAAFAPSSAVAAPSKEQAQLCENGSAFLSVA